MYIFGTNQNPKASYELVRCNDKPGFVVGSYLSRRIVANTLKRSAKCLVALQELLPSTSCCGQGLPSYSCYHKHWWALTPPFHLLPIQIGSLLSVALALRLLWPSVKWSPISRVARTFLS